MKKLLRNPEKFNVIELFATMAAKSGYDLNDPVAQNDIIELVRASIEESKASENILFGKRIEYLFAYVAGALGKVKLLKQEDSGDIYFDGDGIIAPDYRLTMHEGEQILVEVKNCNHKKPQHKFTIKNDYYEKLKGYSDINQLQLMFAVYFSAWNRWTLLSIESFDKTENKYSIDFVTAMAKSEMLKLGDCMVGATPNLELHLLTSSEEAHEIDESGKALFVTREVKIYCANQEVTVEQEKRIAFYLMRFGNWVESESKAIVRENKLHGIKIIYSPEHQEQPNFAIIGNLSTMVSNAFKELTVKDGQVVALTLCIDPATFSALIPEDYKGDGLPLWRFRIQANPDFKGVED